MEVGLANIIVGDGVKVLGTVIAPPFEETFDFLLEDGGNLLLEDGSNLLLEEAK